jgi:hypothetical protein
MATIALARFPVLLLLNPSITKPFLVCSSAASASTYIYSG